MKSLKIVSTLLIVAGFALTFASCSKDKDAVTTVTKDQLLGKWNMDVILPGGFIEKDQVTLKAGGVMEMDIEPQDGITDFILSWDANNNVFTAHLDLNGVSNIWKLNAHIDPEILLIAGEKTMINAGNNPITLIFGMEKQ